MIQRKLNSVYIRLKNEVLIFCCLGILSLFSCCIFPTNPGKYNTLKKYLFHLQGGYLIDNYNTIIFVSEKTCPACSKSFSQAVEQFVLGKDSVLTIVNAKGKNLNIEGYLDFMGKNLVFDYTDNFYHLQLATGSCIILLKSNQIDSVISISPDNLYESINSLR